MLDEDNFRATIRKPYLAVMHQAGILYETERQRLRGLYMALDPVVRKERQLQKDEDTTMN
jgi:hypothetical protein